MTISGGNSNSNVRHLETSNPSVSSYVQNMDESEIKDLIRDNNSNNRGKGSKIPYAIDISVFINWCRDPNSVSLDKRQQRYFPLFRDIVSKKIQKTAQNVLQPKAQAVVEFANRERSSNPDTVQKVIEYLSDLSQLDINRLIHENNQGYKKKKVHYKQFQDLAGAFKSWLSQPDNKEFTKAQVKQFELFLKVVEGKLSHEKPAVVVPESIHSIPHPTSFTGAKLVDSKKVEVNTNCAIHFVIIDEEGAAAVSDIMQLSERQNKNVYLIDKDHECGGSNIFGTFPKIFQKPFMFYGIERVEHSFPEGTAEHELSEAIQYINKNDEKQYFTVPEEKVKMNGEGKLNLYRLHETENATGDVFVYRSAELGYQQGLAEWYAREVIAALRDHSINKYGIKATIAANMLGTAGAIKEDVIPGTNQVIGGSFYIGHSRNAETGLYKAVIMFASPRNEEKIYTSDEVFSTKKQATNHAEAFWKKLSEFRTRNWEHLRAEELRDVTKIVENAPTYDAIAKIDSILSLGINTSQTVPFFDGEEFKKDSVNVFRKQVDPVAMEDYAFLKAMHGMNLTVANFVRFITNSKVPSSFAQAFGEWYPKSSFSEDDYLDAILWGLEGQDPLHIPGSAVWDIFDDKNNSEELILETMVALDHNNKPVLINPFYAEIGADMLNDLVPVNNKPGKAFPSISELMEMNGIDSLTDREKQELRDQMVKLGEQAELVKRIYNPQSVDNCKTELKALIEGLKCFTLTSEGIEKKIHFLDNPSKEGLEIWIRKGKWKYDEQELNCTFVSQMLGGSGEEVSSETLKKLGALDRMLYKMTVVGMTRGLHTYQRIHRLPETVKKPEEDIKESDYNIPRELLLVSSVPLLEDYEEYPLHINSFNLG